MSKPKSIRFSTLVKKYGPVTLAKPMSDEAWNKAVEEGRFATVYHGENGDWCTPVLALVRHHGFCNTICKIAFAKPLPPEVKTIVGMKDNDDAFTLCNP
jgi:hypothetical protein